MKEQILEIVLLPLAAAPIGFWIFASAVYLLSLPIMVYQELSDREGHRRRKELWARLKESGEKEL